MNILARLALVILILGAGPASAYVYGPIDFGVSTDDGKHLLPYCGTYYLSKTTSLKSCIGMIDAYRLPAAGVALKKLSVMGFANDAIVQYAEGYGLFLIINNSMNIEGESTRNASSKVVDIALFSFSRFSPSGSGLDPFFTEEIEAKLCLQGFVTDVNEISLICANDDEVFLYQLRSQAWSKPTTQRRVLFTSAQAGVSKAHMAIPTYTFDPKKRELVNSHPVENLGGGSFTLPMGTISLN